MEAIDILGIAAALALASALQSAAGFGFALLCVPLLLLLGVRPEEAVVLVSLGGLAQNVMGVAALRRHVHWGRVGGMVALGVLGVPAGVLVLGLLTEQSVVLVRRLLGALVLLALVLQFTCRPRPRDRVPRAATVGAMLASGFMGGLASMSGPPAVLWVLAHRWSSHESRATLWAYFGGIMPVQIVLLWLRFGETAADAALLGLALLPATLVGLLPGLWVGHRLPKPHLRTVATAILVVVAITAMAG